MKAMLLLSIFMMGCTSVRRPVGISDSRIILSEDIYLLGFDFDHKLHICKYDEFEVVSCKEERYSANFSNSDEELEDQLLDRIQKGRPSKNQN